MKYHCCSSCFLGFVKAVFLIFVFSLAGLVSHWCFLFL
uniref:Uncharacterized protein n=1 Tax=Arundo donax TaxID=35708 RepID=A0A0A9EGN1_ARUDO